jgi:hypothetical protein
MNKKFSIAKTAFKTAAKATAISILLMFVIMIISLCQGANTKDINAISYILLPSFAINFPDYSIV